MLSPKEIVNKMYTNDDYSKWLGISFIDVGLGFCRIKMEVRQEMTNGFDVAHGGVTFAFADSAFAFASNSLGRHAVSIETSISHTRPVLNITSDVTGTGEATLSADGQTLEAQVTLTVVNILGTNGGICTLVGTKQ